MIDLRVPSRTIGAVDADVDGQRVLLSPKDFAYLGIEGSGAAVWDLVDGQRTIDQIVARLEEQFEAPTGAIRAEAVAFIAALADAGLVDGVDASVPQR